MMRFKGSLTMPDRENANHLNGNSADVINQLAEYFENRARQTDRKKARGVGPYSAEDLDYMLQDNLPIVMRTPGGISNGYARQSPHIMPLYDGEVPSDYDEATLN